MVARTLFEHPCRYEHVFTFLTTAAMRVVVATVATAMLAVPFASAADAAITRPFTPRATMNLAPGITFQSGTMRTTGGRPQQVRVGIVDPHNEQVRLKALLSNDLVIRREVVSRIALAKQRPGFRPIIATNGDMSTRERVDGYAAPHSMAVSNGELLLATACARPTLGVDAEGNVRIDNVRSQGHGDPAGPSAMRRAIHKVNVPRDTGQIVLYTKRYASRTRTSYGGIEVVLDLQDTLRPNDVQQVRVVNVRRGGGNTPLRGRAGCALGQEPQAEVGLPGCKVGERFPLQTPGGREQRRALCRLDARGSRNFDDIVEVAGRQLVHASRRQDRGTVAVELPVRLAAPSSNRPGRHRGRSRADGHRRWSALRAAPASRSPRWAS